MTMFYAGRRRALAGFCTGLFGLALAACATVPEAAPAPAQQSVAIATADGSADAVLLLPPGQGAHPAVIVWPDITGLRPAYAEVGRKLANEGYVVLVPNSFYRSVKLDGSAATAQPFLPFPGGSQRAAPMRAAASDEAVIADTRAFVAYLDALPQVDKQRAIGAIGYDVGGAHAFIAARAVPDRIAAVVALHPLAVATARDTSPHLHVNESKASYLVEIAQPDDEREPGDKDDLRTAFAAAGLYAAIEIVPAGHGYAVPDDPAYDAAAAEAAWARTLALLQAALR